MTSKAAPLISVVIPTHDRQYATDAAVRSACAAIAAFDRERAELIVVDDASPDPYVMPDHDPGIRARLVRREDNGGASAARNCGIAAARGQWIAQLDSDDVWGALRLVHAAMFIEQNRVEATGDTALCCASAAPDGSIAVPMPAGRLQEFARGVWFNPGSTALIPRCAFETLGGYDPALRRLEDYDWFLRFGHAGGRLLVDRQADAFIDRGRCFDVALIDACCTLLEQRWQHIGAWPTVRAYLALERAAVRVRAGRWLAAAGWLVRSWIAHPRASLMLARSERLPGPHHGWAAHRS